MPKATCQLNLTLDVPVAEAVERISNEIHLRPSGGGRVLLLERLELEQRGWKAQDNGLKELLMRICVMDSRQRDLVEEFIAGLGDSSLATPTLR